MRNPDTPEVIATKRRLDIFLAKVERRAYRMALLATRQRDDALDIVQDAMLVLVRSYAHKPEGEWAPLFYRILQSRIAAAQGARVVAANHRSIGKTNALFSRIHRGQHSDDALIHNRAY